MEDDLNFEVNGRRPKFIGKMGDNLHFLEKWETTLIFLKWQNGRRQKSLVKSEDDLNLKDKDNLNCFEMATWKTTKKFGQK